MFTIPNFIAGRHVAPAQYFDDIEPATGQAYARVPDSDARDVDEAVRAAAKAFPAWSRTPVIERSRLLLAVAQGIEANRERLARAESVDTGKPLRQAQTLDI